MPDAQNPEEEAETSTEIPVITEAAAPSDAGDSSAGTTQPAKAAKKAPARKAAKKSPARKTAKKPATTPQDDTGLQPSGSDDAVGAIESPDVVASPDVDVESRPRKRAAAKAPAKPVSDVPEALFQAPESAPAAEEKAAKKTTTRKRAAKKVAASSDDESADQGNLEPTSSPAEHAEAPANPAKKAAKQPSRKKATAAGSAVSADSPRAARAADDAHDDNSGKSGEDEAGPARRKTGRKSADEADENSASAEAPSGDTGTDPADDPANDPANDPAGGAAHDASDDADSDADDSGSDHTDGEAGEGSARRRPRRRGGRRRRGRGGNGDHGDHTDASDDASGNRSHEDKNANDSEDSDDDSGEGGSRRRRQRQRKPRNLEDEITSVQGSTRLEAKKQRRREGREAGRRRAPIVSEAEFLARRESVDRVMVIRQREDLTQIGVLEDNVLVEHYVSRQSQTSLIGNVYLGRVQNVLPSMEAAFVDIGKGRNAVIYAGEVNWSALGHKDGQPRKIESVLSSGQTILVQVTKDPIGHKGARLSGQVSLPGRFLVYVPDGNTSGISRKLPDTERHRLKTLLKKIVPDSAGVIVRTAAEGASEEELTQDVERLTARWNDIEAKVKIGKSPELLYGEPDLTLKVVRDLFTEDFTKLVVQGDDAWDLVEGYVSHVAPDLKERLERFEPDESNTDLFAAYRVDEQIAKGLDRKVWLPSGGSLIIDRTEAMTVIDVNTGKFTGSGGNLEETVTKNNLEAAEEVVRQLRLRDIGGIIVIDFIDMVLESNRDLVLRRLVECLGRDRTRHQVAEVTSLGLVQMTRKRIGTGLVESFSEDCTHCKGRGVVVHDHPIEPSHQTADDEPRRGRGRGNHGGSQGNNHGGGGGGRGRGRGGHGSQDQNNSPGALPKPPSPADLAGTKPKPVENDETTAGVESPVSGVPVQEASVQEAPTREAPAQRIPQDDAPAVEVPAKDAPGGAEESQGSQAPSEANAVDSEAVTPPAPTVVSTTRRRRTATRPAGPPARSASASTAGPGTDAGPNGDAHAQAGPGADAAEAPSGVSDAGEGPAVAARTGADDGAASAAAPESATEPATESGAESGAGSDIGPVAEGDVANVLHVPVKRKGTRKR